MLKCLSTSKRWLGLLPTTLAPVALILLYWKMGMLTGEASWPRGQSGGALLVMSTFVSSLLVSYILNKFGVFNADK